jgi:hypothetical protein
MSEQVKRTLVIVGVLAAIAYLADFGILELKMMKGQKPFSTVQVENFSAVPEKNNRVEFFYGDPDTEECVQALFPHRGDNPCWYVNRHRVNKTDL